MKPLTISETSASIVTPYPAAVDLLACLREMKPEERRAFIRLWLLEGIPWAFREAPMLYEATRAWLGVMVGVHAKFITLIGSARIGYSMATPPAYGRSFGEQSDLDFTIISDSLFDRVKKDFQQWRVDFEHGIVMPGNERSGFFWRENVKRVPRNIHCGFVDSYKIPPLPRYQHVRNIEQTTHQLQLKLSVTPRAPRVRRISTRIYKDWDACLVQAGINLDRLAATV